MSKLFGRIGHLTKKLGVIGSNVIKKVGQIGTPIANTFSTIAPSLGHIGNVVSSAAGHPKIGAGIQRGLETAGRVSAVGGLLGYRMQHGSMAPQNMTLQPH